MAVAMDRDRRSGAANFRHRSAVDGRVSEIYLHAIGCRLRRMDGAEISIRVRTDPKTSERRALGDGGWYVGGAGPQYARWRVPGTAAVDRQALLPIPLWRGCAHWLEPGFLWLQLAAATDLQAFRSRLLRYPEDGVE